MTDDPGRPNLARRRHIDERRAYLGLKSVPHYVGSELRKLTPLFREQLQHRVLREGAPAALSPGGRERLLSALVAAVEEFALIVANRPLPGRSVEAPLVELLRDQGPAGLDALEDAVDTLREVMRERWECQPHLRSHIPRLGVALDRYVARFRATLHSSARVRPDRGRAHQAGLEELLAEVQRLWGGGPVQLCLMVGALAAHDDPAPPRAQPQLRACAPDRLRRSRLVHGLIDDHVLVVAEHPAAAPRAARAGRAAPVAVWAGPVPAGEPAAAYGITLLRFRLIVAGVATPSSDLVPLPNLGFLLAPPTHATVARIKQLLGPLMQLPPRRRLTLARTLLQRLSTGGTGQAIADHLGVSAQSVRNHLGELCALYDDQHLDFDGETLEMRVALELVLPLWERASSGSPPWPRERDAQPG